MTNEELQDRLNAIEATQFLMFTLIIRTSPNPSLTIKAAKKVIELIEEDKHPFPTLAKEQIFSIFESVENTLEG